MRNIFRGDRLENKKDLDLLIEKASKMKKENPEVFEKN